MSLAGLKKQLNKANQYMSEKMGSAEPTRLDEEFKEMEKKTDITAELIENLILRTKEYLQPNPASRAKMNAINSYAKMRGQAKQHAYPQAEGVLGDTMCKYGGDLGAESVFGQSLIEAGEALRQMAEVKYALEDQVRQNFLDPLHLLSTKDIKDLLHHRKKLESRRLDFDCKKRKRATGGGGITEEEIRGAEEKFEESKSLAESAMYSLLDNEVEQVSQLVALVEAQVEFHKQNAAILESLLNTLYMKRDEASQKVREPRQPRPTTISINRGDSPAPSPFDENGRDSPEDGVLDANSWSGGGITASPAKSPSPLPSPAASHASRQMMTSDTPVNFGSSLVPPPKQSAPAASAQLSSPVAPLAPPSAVPLYPSYDSFPTIPTNGVINKSPPQTGPTPSCKALFDFDPENEGELGFVEGDVITLVDRVDDNWYEGSLKGKSGVFPVTYVEVLVDVPKK